MVTSDRQTRLTGLFMAGLAGDTAQYERFLREIALYLRRFVGRRVPPGDVEDVLQEILISIHKARTTFDGKRSILPWVSAIARFRLADYLRRYYARAAGVHVQLDEAEKQQAAGLLDNGVTVDGDLSEYVQGEVGLLPERQRKILYLMHTEGFTAREAGARLGMKESAVKTAAHRAYKLIRSRLKKTEAEKAEGKRP
jgi:RNA polymerase sigma-70 factor (ECF subfamily)